MTISLVNRPMMDNDPALAQILKGRSLIIASNRGPVTFTHESEGKFGSRKGSGGVVTAVSSIARAGNQPIWVACAMTSGDRKRAEFAASNGETLIASEGPHSEFLLRFVVPSPRQYHGYYNVISNPLLWFLQHYLWDTPRSPDITRETTEAWTQGYMAVNALFADEIARAAKDSAEPPIVMLQDYHLYLTPTYLREHLPDAIIQQFVHIPWPDPDYWRLLPDQWRRAICEGLLGNDIVGFQTTGHVRSFLFTCESYVPGVQIDYLQPGVIWNGRRIEARAYPISIDADAVRQIASSKESRVYDSYLAGFFNEFNILRVDRAEPSKNIVRGFQAYADFLDTWPEFQGRVNFVAVLVPSRMDLAEYQNYLDEVSAIVGRINAKYADVSTGWQPIQLVVGENYPRALAAMKWYDVLMVNSIIDGMNLVAKEGALLNDRNGVMILSEGAGAAAQLGEHALLISPADVQGTSEAIHEALTMPFGERRRRAEAMRRIVEADDVAIWFRDQIVDIDRYLIKGKREAGSMLPNGEIAGKDALELESMEELTDKGKKKYKVT